MYNRLPIVKKSPKINTVFRTIFSVTTLVIEAIFGVIYPIDKEINGDETLKHGAIFFVTVIVFIMLLVSEYYSVKRYSKYIRKTGYMDDKRGWTLVGIYPMAFSAIFAFLYTGVFNCR